MQIHRKQFFFKMEWEIANKVAALFFITYVWERGMCIEKRKTQNKLKVVFYFDLVKVKHVQIF